MILAGSERLAISVSANDLCRPTIDFFLRLHFFFFAKTFIAFQIGTKRKERHLVPANRSQFLMRIRRIQFSLRVVVV